MLSVIIPTRNRAAHLRPALESLLYQTLPQDQFEVLVVDNGSEDDTAEVCREFAPRFSRFERIYAPSPGLHEGRHAGLLASRHDLLTFADDDIVATETWLGAIKEAFQDPRVGLVGGPNLPLWESSPPHWLWEMWQTETVRWGRRLGTLSLIDFGEEAFDVDPYYVYGCNFSVRKSVVMEAGGFHPDGMPQDLIHLRGDGESYISGFVLERGLVARYHPEAAVRHLVPTSRMNLDYFRKRAFNQGISDSFAAIRRHGGIPEVAEPPRWLRYLKKFVGHHLLRRDISELRAEIDKGEFRRAVERSHQAGYHFHQERCRRDPELLRWVLQDSFLRAS